jgi:hypothetical protein
MTQKEADALRLKTARASMAADIEALSPILRTAAAFLLCLCGRGGTTGKCYELADGFLETLKEDCEK